jgi:predicted PurR-regulated permease PerM
MVITIIRATTKIILVILMIIIIVIIIIIIIIIILIRIIITIIIYLVNNYDCHDFSVLAFIASFADSIASLLREADISNTNSADSVSFMVKPNTLDIAQVSVGWWIVL